MRYGIDLSHDNYVSDWNLVKGSDIEFCFVKSSEGVTIQDPMYRQHCLGASRVKIPTYPYHFFRPLDDGIDQAKNFLMCAGSFKRMALDLEECPGSEDDQWDLVDEQTRYKRIKDFLSLMPSGAVIETYITNEFYAKYLSNAGFLGQETGLWIARYNNETGPLPSAWTGYNFWQHDEHGIVPGIKGDVDLSFAADSVIL